VAWGCGIHSNSFFKNPRPVPWQERSVNAHSHNKTGIKATSSLTMLVNASAVDLKR
jgi:hypothetical protein